MRLYHREPYLLSAFSTPDSVLRGRLAYWTVKFSQIQETDMPSFRAANALIPGFFTDGA